MPTLGGRKRTSAGDRRASWLRELQAHRAGPFNERAGGVKAPGRCLSSERLTRVLPFFFQEPPVPAGRLWGSPSRPAQGGGGGGGRRAGAVLRCPLPAPGSARTLPPAFQFPVKQTKSPAAKGARGHPSQLRLSPGRAVPSTASLPGGSESPGGAGPGGCRVPPRPPPARLPTTSLNRPAHGLKSRDAFEFIECMMSLTRHQT